jgi:ABC-type multidrug transport system fused ATPase/permease subunit
MLRIIHFEIRKLVEQPMILLFFIACLLLNTIYIVTAGLDKSYLNYVQETEAKTGNVITSEFHEKLANQSTSRKQQRLLSETAELENVFQDYSTEAMGQEIIDFYQIQGPVAEKMKKKYGKLTPVVSELGEEQAALEIGAAGETMSFFTFIRNRLFRAILGESLIFAILLGLYGSTSERLTKTDVLVMTSKTGRKTQLSKYIASLMLTILFYIMMVMLTFGIFRHMYPLGTLWQTSMSTQFHLNVYIPHMLEVPFIPWQPMTLLNYTILSIVLGGLLIILCQGFNFLLGLWTDHLFRGFIVFIVIYVVFLGLEQIINQFGWWNIHSLLMWHPISLWNTQGYWFTEMGPYATIPWQESIAMVVNLFLLGVGGILTSKFYGTKEVK